MVSLKCEEYRETMENLKRVVLVIGLVLVLIEGTMGVQHTVGGSQGWDESTDFDSWAKAQTFKVGDQLVFKYSQMHSVVELGSKSDYDSCNTGTAVNSMNSGKDVVKLTKAGTRYFTCGTLGHCGQGMKLKVTTVAGGAPSSIPESTSSSSTSPTTETTSTSASGLRSLSLLTIPLVILGVFGI